MGKTSKGNSFYAFYLISILKMHAVKLEILNLRETVEVLNLTIVKNINEIEKCLLTLEGKYFPEIPYVYLYCDAIREPVKNIPDLTSCSNFDCWESQLTLVSRVEIVNIMNRYREKVAKKLCDKWCEKNKIHVIFELRWDLDTELEAIKMIRNCPRNHAYSGKSTKAVDSGRDVLVWNEDAVVSSFSMRTGLQNELRVILWRLIAENYLKDWNEETWQFRRSLSHDVGCAFIVRREINYVTDLGENIENGNVGHFACIFKSALPQPDHEFDSEQPSSEKCQKRAGAIITDFNANNLFPYLCRIDPQISKHISVLKESSHVCKEGPANITDICRETTYSSVTWKEKFYGLILKRMENENFSEIGECNVPQNIPTPVKYGENVYNYNCTLKEEVYVLGDTSKCPNWDCADSQLTDITRLQILKHLNEARQKVAKGECSHECPHHPCKFCEKNYKYCNMVKLQWHWFLERKASQIVRNCPSENSLDEGLVYEDNPFPDPVIFDQITLVFDLPKFDGQMALGKTITKLFWTNEFRDWSNNNVFRRANAVFIGCAIIRRSSSGTLKINFYKGTITHMVCIYMTFNRGFISVVGNPNVPCCPNCSNRMYPTWPCQLNFINDAPHTSLCSPTFLQLTMNCQINYCKDDGISVAWNLGYSGTISVQNVDGSFHTLIVYPFNTVASIFARKYCLILIILYMMVLVPFGVLTYLIYSRKIAERDYLPEEKFDYLMKEEFPTVNTPVTETTRIPSKEIAIETLPPKVIVRETHKRVIRA